MQPLVHDIKTKQYFIDEVKVSESSSKISKIIPRRLLMFYTHGTWLNRDISLTDFSVVHRSGKILNLEF